MTGPHATASDTLDLADLFRTLRRQWRAVVACMVVGVAGAIAVMAFFPPRFDGTATVLARGGSGSGTSILSRMTGLGELMGGATGLTGMTSPLETELQLLRSRALAGQVVDSLGLQFSIKQPRGTPPMNIVARWSLASLFKARKFMFTRLPEGGYRVEGDSAVHIAAPGKPLSLSVGEITLRDSLPKAFALTAYDREDAIDRFAKRLEAIKAGGDVAKITYRGEDSVTAAAAPNALIAFYLERRKTTDRGVNARRVEYVTAQLADAGAQLSRAEHDLRVEQDKTGVLDAEINGKVDLEAAAELRKSLTDIAVDQASIAQLLSKADAGALTSSDIAAYPSFLKGGSVGTVVAQMTTLETERTRLLERRTPRDPEVVALDSTIRNLSNVIIGQAHAYAASMTMQRDQMQGRLDSMDAVIQALPASAEKGGRLKRDVLRLTQLYAALQAQLVEARLAAIGEGGDVRQVDVAAIPRKPAFPEPILTMGIGVGGGLLVGVVAALMLGWFGRWLRDPLDVERLTGVSVQRLQPSEPLLLAGRTTSRTILVVPLDDTHTLQAALVAERLARSATVRAARATVLDLSATASTGNGNGAVPHSPTETIEQLETGHDLLVVHLPSLWSETTFAALRASRPVLLVAPPGPVDRGRLQSAVEMLRRLDIPCAGIVMSERARVNGRAPTVPARA